MRNFPDWLTAYCDYASFSEAPRRMHFWVGVSAIAGALRRKVWIDMQYFKWHANNYIILVAPPGIVSKSTTAGIGMGMLRKVPGIKFGPDVVTWQALVGDFVGAAEEFRYGDSWYPMSAMTIESSEFGNLLNPQDREMVDFLVNLWDGKQGSFEKRTKMSGNDSIINPWINIVACTTPSWIAGNFPDYMIGGGFTSRCLFVYADKKEKYVAYPKLVVPEDIEKVEAKLVEDLEHISLALVGPYELTKDAYQWGESWYHKHYTQPRPEGMNDDRFGGYIARKQTHLHKVAMVIAAAQSDAMVIEAEHLHLADIMITGLEEDMPKVFDKIGRTAMSNNADRLLHVIIQKPGITLADAYKAVHSAFPTSQEFTQVLEGFIRSGQITMHPTTSGGMALRPTAPREPSL